MGWHAELRLAYRRQGEQTLAQFEHSGPLRVLKSLYPEGPSICHHVLVHPPAGVVGGDRLALHAQLGTGTHALLTTPGATRFYRSAGDEAVQEVAMQLEPGARLEWLPGENIVHDAALVTNRLHFRLEGDAQMLGWDVLALGLPAAGQPFTRGHVMQRIEVEGAWLEQARIDAGDALLLDSALGLAGHRALATLWWAGGSAGEAAALERALQAARDHAAGAQLVAGASLLHPRLLLLRALADRVEPLMALLREVRACWRRELWQLAAPAPRIWST